MNYLRIDALSLCDLRYRTLAGHQLHYDLFSKILGESISVNHLPNLLPPQDFTFQFLGVRSGTSIWGFLSLKSVLEWIIPLCCLTTVMCGLGYGNTNVIGDNETPASAGDNDVAFFEKIVKEIQLAYHRLWDHWFGS